MLLQSYAQTNPLEIYQQEGYARFKKLNQNIHREVLKYVTHSRLQIRAKEPEDDSLKGLQTNDVKETTKKKPVEKQTKVGPNELCPCGSGKKYKFCHGLK